ncbi:MAG: hypothetical protein K6A05_05320, partial [Lachnospiraceae bacterium]|nr:hypothetical protein [Lachnospiraceae bacterium]
MTEGNASFKRLVYQISLSDSSSAIDCYQMGFFAAIEFFQLFFFFFSSNHDSIITDFIWRSTTLFNDSPLN